MTSLKNTLRKHPHWTAVLAILGFAVLLCAVQILERGMISSVDIVFHYNRFYDTAMQIKEGNFSYFLTLYGYQQSGRIVNALYGPYFAYFQGFLVLLSGTWFRYQILSRILLATMAGCGLYKLMQTCKVRFRWALPLSLVFMTTYAVQYWSMQQGFSSWGAALFPLCFNEAARYYRTRQLRPLAIGASVALMLQVHVLSTLFLALSYVPIFLWGFYKDKAKWRFVSRMALGGLTFVLLTVNVWLPLLDVQLHNSLLDPFVNKDLVFNTINAIDFPRTLLAPFFMVLVVLYQLYAYYQGRGKHSSMTKVIFWTYFMFLVFSSNLFPWFLVAGKGIRLVELIQFPFRFFFYASSLLMVVLGLQLQEQPLSLKWRKWAPRLVWGAALLGLAQNLVMNQLELNATFFSQNFYKNIRNNTIRGTADEIRASYFTNDLGRFVYLVNKWTPDYVPYTKTSPRLLEESRTDGLNTYQEYNKYIVQDQTKFTHEVEGPVLKLTWQADQAGPVNVPVVIYADTIVTLNGETLREEDYQISRVGSPTVQQQAGTNTLTITYRDKPWLVPVHLWTLLAWTLTAIGLWRMTQKGGKHAQAQSIQS